MSLTASAPFGSVGRVGALVFFTSHGGNAQSRSREDSLRALKNVFFAPPPFSSTSPLSHIAASRLLRLFSCLLNFLRCRRGPKSMFTFACAFLSPNQGAWRTVTSSLVACPVSVSLLWSQRRSVEGMYFPERRNFTASSESSSRKMLVSTCSISTEISFEWSDF